MQVGVSCPLPPRGVQGHKSDITILPALSLKFRFHWFKLVLVLFASCSASLSNSTPRTWLFAKGNGRDLPLPPHPHPLPVCLLGAGWIGQERKWGGGIPPGLPERKTAAFSVHMEPNREG